MKPVGIVNQARRMSLVLPCRNLPLVDHLRLNACQGLQECIDILIWEEALVVNALQRLTELELTLSFDKSSL